MTDVDRADRWLQRMGVTPDGGPMAKQKKPETVKAAEPKKRARQQDLPGTEDRKIKALEEAANAYADIRDERMALNVREHELKTALLAQMKKLGKAVYHRDGIEILVVPEAESIRVRVKKVGDDAEASTAEFDEERRQAVAED